MPALVQIRQRNDQRQAERPARPSAKRRKIRRTPRPPLPEVPDWIERVLTLYTPSRKSEQRWRALSVAVVRLGKSPTQFGDFASQVWDDGFYRLASRMNARSGVALREARERRIVASLAANARNVADIVERIVRAKPGENDFATKSLVWNALTQEIIKNAENGPTPVGARFRFPGLITSLRTLAEEIDRCLESRITPGEQVETQAAFLDAFQLNAVLGDQARPASIVDFLTDSKGDVHYSVWRMLLELLHPTLTGKIDTRDLKRFAQRKSAPQGGNPQH